MNNPALNNETLVSYLLGSLPEAETERLDELSITDDEFAVALSAAEKDLVDAYVQNELTGVALKKFQSYYLASPLRRGRVIFAQAFEALAGKHPTAQSATAREGFPSELATRPKRSGWFAGRGFFTTPSLAWQWRFALAAIALLVAGIWLLSENMRLRQQVSQMQERPEAPGTREHELQNELEWHRQTVTQTEEKLARVREERERLEAELQQARESQVATSERNSAKQQRPSSTRGVSIAYFILTPQMRSVQQMPTISIPAGAEHVAMQLELEPNDYRAYRVALINQTSNQNLWHSRKITTTASDSRTLRVSLRSSLLKPEAYVLRVTGISANGVSEIVGDYRFRVLK